MGGSNDHGSTIRAPPPNTSPTNRSNCAATPCSASAERTRARALVKCASSFTSTAAAMVSACLSCLCGLDEFTMKWISGLEPRERQVEFCVKTALWGWKAMWRRLRIFRRLFFKEFNKSFGSHRHILQLAFPYRHYSPTVLFKQCDIALVPPSVPRKLGKPVLAVVRRNVCMDASLMVVPKAPIHKDDLAPRREHQIRASGQVISMQSIPVSETMEQSPHQSLRSGVFRLDPGHDSASGRG